MSKSTIEELIESAKNERQPKYLRKGWTIQAKSLLRDAIKEIDGLERQLILDK